MSTIPAIPISAESIEAFEAPFLTGLWVDALDRRVPPALKTPLIAHLLALTRGAPIEVRHAAFDATLRRLKFAVRDELRVTQAPGRTRVFGAWVTGRPRGEVRPWATRLDAVHPLAGSCACPDFSRNSLGLCKHLLVVLLHLAGDPGRWALALGGGAPERPRVRLDPIRPLEGPGDWFARVEREGAPKARLAGWDEVRPGVYRPSLRVLAQPAARLKTLRTLHHRLMGPLSIFVDPALPGIVSEAVRLGDERARLGVSPEALSKTLLQLSRKLYPYQREGVDRFFETGRLLLADDMGLGKTTQAIAICHAARATRKVKRGLLIVPASLKSQWAREWRATTRVPLTVVEGSREARKAIWSQPPTGFLLAHYEQVVRDLPQVQAFGAELVVLDEAQRIKNWETRTALSVKQLTPPYRLVLTGTPLENRLDELASIMEWVDDRALEPRWRLAPLHTIPASMGVKGGARYLETLRQRLAPVFLRRTRQQVLGQLPPRRDTVVPVPLTAEQAGAHAELDLPIARLVAASARRPLLPAEFLRLMGLLTTQRIICNGIALQAFPETWPDLERLETPSESALAGLHSPKLLELRELVRSICVEQGRKLVIFSQWRRMLLLAQWALRDLLAEAGLRAVFFTGEESLHQRTRSVEDLHDDPKTAVFLATDAGGVGLNLQRAATALVHLDLPWNPAVFEQRVGRIHRMGQTQPIDVYSLVSSEGIEARISELVEDKRALFDGLFEGTTDAIEFQRAQSFAARLEKLVDADLVAAATNLPESADGEDAELLPENAGAPEAPPVAAGPTTPRSTLTPLSTAAAETSGDEAEATKRESAASAADRPAPVQAGTADGDRSGAVAHAGAQAVESLFSRVSVRTTPEGGLILEAPPEAAATLASLFRGMAGLLEASAAPATSTPESKPDEEAHPR